MAKKVLFQISVEENEKGEMKVSYFIEKAVPPPVMVNHLARGIQIICGGSIIDEIKEAKPDIWLPDNKIKLT